MTQNDRTTATAEERVARHLAAKDHPRTGWDAFTDRCRDVYMADARKVVAIMREATAAVAPPADRAGLRQRIAEALRPGSRDRSGQYPEGLLRDVDAVLAVLSATDQQAAVRAEAFEEAADIVDGWDTVPSTREAADYLRGMAGEARRLAGETQQDRCPSCDHKAEYHDVDSRCWFTVDHGVAGSNLGCPCAPRRDDDEAQQDPAPGGETVPWGVCPDCRAAAGPDCDCPPYSDEPDTAPVRSGQPDTNQETPRG